MKGEGCHVIHSGVEILEWISAAGSASASLTLVLSLNLPLHPLSPHEVDYLPIPLPVWCPTNSPLPPPQLIPYI